MVYLIFWLPFTVIGVALEEFVTKDPAYFAFYGFFMACLFFLITRNSAEDNQQ